MAKKDNIISGMIDVNSVSHRDGSVEVEFFDACAWEGIHMDRDEAIAAARAILKNFNCGMED